MKKKIYSRPIVDIEGTQFRSVLCGSPDLTYGGSMIPNDDDM